MGSSASKLYKEEITKIKNIEPGLRNHGKAKFAKIILSYYIYIETFVLVFTRL